MVQYMVEKISCTQTNEVNSEYEALFSVIHPILTGLALSLKKDIVDQVGGYDKISLELFNKVIRAWRW